LHRQIWIDNNGKIPEGAHIHHEDNNPLNNDIKNLVCLTPKQHCAEHPWDIDRIDLQSELLKRIRPLTKAWHKSEEGLKKHAEIGAMAYNNFVSIEKTCKNCECLFLTKKLGHLDEYCSNKCKSAYRRKTGIDNEQRTCECGKEFTANKYSKTKYCSRSCSNYYSRWKSR
jgi:hypothetical protein